MKQERREESTRDWQHKMRARRELHQDLQREEMAAVTAAKVMMKMMKGKEGER